MAVSDNTSTTYMLDNRLSGYALYHGYSLDSGYTNCGTSYVTGATSYFKIKDSYGNDVTRLFYPDCSNSDAFDNYMACEGSSFIWHMVPTSSQNETIVFYKNEESSIGNIPMGELTFNGVQSVTYNGTDYTKLVVDGTSYPPPVMISFTIDGASYQAEEGMTWAEWVASSYNTGDFIISNDSPTDVNYYLIKTSSDGFLQATDAIISGEAYFVSKKEK